jgi:hypothetical protein
VFTNYLLIVPPGTYIKVVIKMSRLTGYIICIGLILLRKQNKKLYKYKYANLAYNMASQQMAQHSGSKPKNPWKSAIKWCFSRV